MSSADPNQVDPIDHAFRQEKGRIVASLVRLVGSLEGAEDCFSEALEAAIKSWPEKGTPDNPAAWLNTVARRKALDILYAGKSVNLASLVWRAKKALRMIVSA